LSAGARRSEAARRLVHLGSGALAFSLAYLTILQAAALAGAAILFNALVLPRIGGQALFRDGERRHPIASGILLYPVAVLLLILLFGWRMEVAAAGWVIMAAGDPAAAAAGRRWGVRPLPWNPGKTVLGSAAFVLAAAFAASAILIAMGRPPGQALGLAVPTALFAAFIESLPWRLNDNLTVPLLAALFLLGMIEADALSLPLVLPRLLPAVLPAVATNLVLAVTFRNAGVVDRSGMVAGFLVGVLTWIFGGWQAFLVLTTFFVLGSLTTRSGRKRKDRLGVAQGKKGARSARHALANCGVAVALGVLGATAPVPGLFLLAIVCAYATAAFDTVSSELGQAYGGRPLLITTLRPVPVGTDGAITLLGTLAGAAAAAVVGAVACLTGLIPMVEMPRVLLAAFVGSSADSLLGATLERRGLMNNEAVNFSNTLVGALTGIGLSLLAGGG
jgi:uncharacterized protein (TIGR00297 family)